MRRINVMCLAAVLLTAGFAAAATVWNPSLNPDPNDIVDGVSNWDIAANWSNGLPGVIDQKPVFNSNGGGNLVECQVTTDTLSFGNTANGLVMGDGSAAGILRIMNGGTITKVGGGWSGLGFNNDGGTMIVEEGGQAIFNSHLWFGMEPGGIGRLVINGGYVRVADAVDLGRKAGGNGFLTINDGIFRMRYYPDHADEPGSLCDIRFGTLVIDNNYSSPATPRNQLWSRIDAGTIVGFGGAGELVVTREPFEGATRTMVRAINPMNPSPAYKETVGDGLVDLIWTNMAPNTPGDSVFVDVWFGTEPDKLSLAYTKEVAAGQDTETVQVFAPVIGTPPTTYYWQVDSYIYGAAHINEPNMIKGDVLVFYVTDDFAPTVEIETPNTVTWVNEPVQLDATVSDTGASELFIQWTSSHPGNVTFIPSNTVEDPAVSVDSAVGPVTLTVTVWDALNPETDSDTMVLHVAADPCAAAGVAGVAASFPMNIAGDDCVINIQDLEALIADWLEDFALTEPVIDPRYN